MPTFGADFLYLIQKTPHEDNLCNQKCKTFPEAADFYYFYQLSYIKIT